MGPWLSLEWVKGAVEETSILNQSVDRSLARLSHRFLPVSTKRHDRTYDTSVSPVMVLDEDFASDERDLDSR